MSVMTAKTATTKHQEDDYDNDGGIFFKIYHSLLKIEKTESANDISKQSAHVT